MPDQGQTEQKLLKVLEEAILEEKASAARYQHALELAVEPESKELLSQLVTDEIAHEKMLLERYYAIKKKLGLKVIPKEDE